MSEKPEMILCDCGETYDKKKRHSHYKSKIHRLYIIQIRADYERISLLAEKEEKNKK